MDAFLLGHGVHLQFHSSPVVHFPKIFHKGVWILNGVAQFTLQLEEWKQTAWSLIAPLSLLYRRELLKTTILLSPKVGVHMSNHVNPSKFPLSAAKT